ncbi:MtrAB system histidine kinase MtrB [Arcanobacterium canis]|uniref:Sensor histidine kinase MtrB n=1 Tax=Arcanobacterium canis TaxID=999183 RepID=A0ABY8G1W0_9ACTO|nr:MtrAB system histidine kinase MtrB [Arcanobacterium canis]WFM83761.1 MtrAB system histidine kinase MtrB [Arcanobacterium canis]
MSPQSSNAFFGRLSHRIASLRERWQSSLSTRTMVIIVVGGILGFFIAGAIVVSQIRGAVFNAALQTNIEQFSADATIAQDRFTQTSSPTSGQLQQVANSVVSSMYDPTRGLIGSVLVRSNGQGAPSVQILEPQVATSTQIRSLLTSELRSKTTAGQVSYMSVAVPGQESESPGLILGTALNIPSAGQYELYAAYSLSSQESLIRSTFRVLTFSVVALIVLLAFVSWLIMRLVLRPVQEASASAHQLAEGEFEARMEVRGTDELAQLARSFNQMASSLEDQFTKMERMSKVQTDFVSAVSHELRSPVTTIRMAGQLIFDKREELSPALRRSAELQHDQLKNLDMMLSDLLEISRYDAGGTSLATKPTDVGELARTVIELADPLAQDNGVAVSISVEGNPEAEIEPRRIERILRNLVVNALEHAEGNPVSVRIVGNDTAVAAEVMDWGIGLDEEQAAHVFDRFWRADSSRVRKTGGTGLGLTIAKEDALIHGGTLEATGVMGVGSTFLLTIPKTPHAPFVAPIELVAPEPRTADLTALTMHDEEEQ